MHHCYSEGSGETAHMLRLARTCCCHLCDRYQNHINVKSDKSVISCIIVILRARVKLRTCSDSLERVAVIYVTGTKITSMSNLINQLYHASLLFVCTTLFLPCICTVNVLKLRTLKNNYFFPLFVILEITFMKKCQCS